jgi:hypothetical protein
MSRNFGNEKGGRALEARVPPAHAPERIDDGGQPEAGGADEGKSTRDGPQRSHLRVERVDPPPIGGRQRYDINSKPSVLQSYLGVVVVVADGAAGSTKRRINCS